MFLAWLAFICQKSKGVFSYNARWGQRTPDTRSETIPSSRITPDLQIHSFFSSVHSLIFYRVQIREHLTRDQRPFVHPESLQILQIHSFFSSVHSLIFYRVQVREHLTRDQRPFLHPESLQIFRFTSSSLQFTSLIFYRVQVREHLTRDQRPFLHPESLQIFRFTASPLQFTHSSSTGFRSENTWPEIRDHSFIQNHSRSSDSQLLLFSSPHSSATGFRSENTWHEIKDHSFIQNHSRSSDSQLLLFSSPHSSSTGFRSENTWHEIRDHSFIQNHSRSSDSQLLLFSSLTHLLQGSDSQLLLFSSPHSSSTGFRSENTWHEIRDHSFIQNHSRSSDSQLLLFSSLTHDLQGSGQRTPDTRSETIPSSRITPDLQIHSFFSSVHSSSTGFRSENTWHEIKDHSFIQNHSRSSDSQLLLFSSLTHDLQGSGQRTPDKRSETIPSSRITPDLQIHSFFSSVHSLIFYRVQVREHLTRDQRPFLHPESLQIFRFTASPLQFTSLIFYRVQIREHLTRDQRPFVHPESLQILQIHSFFSSVHSLIFYRVQVREHLTRDQRPFLHPESLQIFRFTSSSLQFTSLIFYRVQVREHLTRDQRPFLHPESLQIFRFTASPLQFTHSSSTGFRSENTWPEIRDHSFIQNHSRSSDSQLLLFSSPHSSSTGFRSENTWHEIKDHSFIQNHSRSSDSQLLLFSSPHSSSTGFRSENTWHEIRDHSFIQNHSRSSDSQLLLFSSLTHLLQGSDSQLLLFSSPHSSSTGFRSENTWHEIRDHSFIQNHSRSSDSQLLLFSSLIFYRVQVREHLTRDQRPFLHPESLQIFRFTASPLHLTHLLQGSGQRTPDPRSEIIPSSRITPDLQIHSFFSSVHSLIFYRVQVREHLTRDQRSFLHPESLQIFRFTASPLQFTHSSSTGFRCTASPLQFTSLIFYRVQIREHLTRDQRSFLHPESLQIFRFTASPLQFTSLIFYRVQVREHLTRDQRSFLHPESLQIFRFTASSLQFTHSSSTGFRSENTWHEIRDHSFIQNHSRSSDSQLLLFSSLTHLLQGSGQRTPDKRSETIPSSRITPDPSDSQLLLFSSLTHLLQGSGQRTPDKRSETIPSSRITPDLQIHSFSSSVHSLIFYRVQIREHLTRDQRSFLHPESLQIFRFTASSLQFTSLIFYRVQIREHLTRDQRPFLHPESLQIFRFTASSLQFTSLIFYRVQIREHLTRDQRPFLHPESLQIFRFTASPLQFTHSSSTGFRFTASPLQFTSLIFYRVQIREHLTRDQRSFLHPESLQIFRFTASSLQFTHLLQGSGQRTPDTRSETIPSSRITPDLQIHSFSSSPHSSSTGFRSENTWPEIRDHSFIQNHSRSSDSQLLLFSSLTHLLQGSGQRTPDTRSEIIPSSRITPDLQIHSFSSSVHSSSTGFRFTASPLQFTSLIFYRVQVREHLTRDQRSFLHPESLQIFRFTASPLQFTSLIFYRVQVREHLTRDQRSFLHPESLQIFRFTASSLQFTHSSSTGSRSENTWHEIRDHSFIQNHSRSSDSQLLLFSSLTHLLQGSGQRTPDKRSETIPSSRITPDPSDSQLLLFSSTHSSSTGFRSENTWHEIRDHSFIQNHSRSSDTQLLLFSSLTHLLQVQVREHLTRDQRSFLHPESLQILQIHSFFSSVHSLIFYRVQVREHLTRDQRSFLHPESLQILQIHSFFSSVHSLIFYRVQIREHLTRDQRPFVHPESLQILQIHSFFSSVHSLIFYRVQVREHLTRDQRPFLHPESLQIFRFTSSSLQFTSLIFYRVQVREHLTRDQRPFLHPESLQIFRFTASPLQFTHSSSTGFRSENTWPEIRDHSFIQNHSRSSDSQLLLFSSPHSSSTGFRSENTWHEIKDHSFIQNHSRSSDSQLLLFSSPHSSSTGFRSENTWHEIRDHSFIQNHSRSSDSQLLLFSSLTHLLQGSDSQLLLFSSPHSSSTGFRSENTWHEIRDHSFIQNHSRSSDSQLLLFSSLTHDLQGSGQRTPDTRSETIPSSRITPDLQIHSFFSSVHSSSTGFRSENTWHEIKDHSFIQNHSRSSDSQLLLFSSLTHDLQGSGQRTPDKRSETIPSSRITPDLQIHSFFSSVHSLIFYRVQVREHLTRDQRPSSRITPDLSDSQLLLFSSLIFYRVQVREHLTRDQRSFLHPESLQIFRFTASSLQFTHLLQGSDQRTPDTRSETIPSSRITPDLQIHSFFSSVHSLIFYRVQVREHLTRDQRPFLHPESLQIFRFTASSLQFTSLIFYRVQIREHLTRDQRPFLHPESLQIFRFTASSLQFTHSSSTGFRSENTWHEIRDHSFIQNHSRSSDSQLLLFSSLTHLLQGSDQRTPDPRSEIIPSSRITPDLQIHSFSSSVHSLIFYRVQVREHEIRDHSFIQNHSRSFRFTASPLQFTHLLQVQVRGLEWPTEAWFCAEWPMLVLFLRFVFGLLDG